MTEWLTEVMGRAGYLPHGVCFAWSPGLLWSTVGADAVIVASYYSIPLALVQFARQRRDLQFNWMVLLFSAFIFACGTTHLLAIWVVWRPDYAVEALAKAITAALSVGTALALWPLVPRLLKLPSVAQLQSVIDKLEAEAQQRRSAEENLGDIEQALAATLAAVGAGFIATDRAGCVVRLNPVAERITGWTQAQARGQSLWQVFELEGRPAAPQGRSAVDMAIEEGITIDKVQHGRCVARGGEGTTVEVRASLLRAQDGTVRGVAMVVRDLSGEMRAQALQEQNLQIQAASRLKSEFLANMSHELRTPLNAIIGFADLMHAGKVAPESAKHRVFVDHIRSSGRHLLHLINDILDLSKVEAGHLDFAPEPVRLSTLATDVLNVLEEQALTKGIAVSLAIDPQVERLVIDPRRLKQVLYNYLSNALKFTPRGGRVVVRAKPEGERLWRLEVEDSGIGIQAENIARLFTEFQQLDSGLTKAHPGTGLGLALTRRLVQAQGGEVGVRSEPGVSTVFHALLPHLTMAPQSAGAATSPAPTPAEATAAATQASGAASVLVVEDNPVDGRLLAKALAGAGFEVELATTAAEALALGGQHAFAAITLDLLLPDRSGLEVLAEIRAAGPNRHTPVLVITVLGSPLPLQAYAVTDVLTKPIHGPAVLAALDRSGVKAHAAEQDRPETGPHSEGVVMVVDDDPRSRELMTAALETASLASAAFDGAELALQALPGLRPAAILLNLAMPGLDGFRMLERVRAMPAGRTLPIFIWTSRDLRPEDLRRLQARADPVLPKGSTDLPGMLAHLRARLAATEDATEGGAKG